jgi:hypothetical protein
MSESKSIYLFVTSQRPDPYVNAIAHCVLHASVERVVFIHVRGTPGAADEIDLSAVALRNVQIQMDLLANGQYRYFDGESSGKTVNLGDVYGPQELSELKDLYLRCLQQNVNWSHRQIAYSALRYELSRMKSEAPNSLFDVTSVSKSLLGDIIAAAILEDIDAFYTFDLRIKPNFDEPWRMLIHEARGASALQDRRYAYVNMVDTPVFRSCANSILVRGPRLILPLGAAVVLLAMAVAHYLIRGEVTTFIQITSIASGVASLLSLTFALWPVRR